MLIHHLSKEITVDLSLFSTESSTYLLESQSEVTEPVAEKKPQNFSLSAVSEVIPLKDSEVLALDAPEDLALNAYVSLEVNNPPEDQALDVLTAGDFLKIME